jgi:hypothetical protein
LKIEDLLLVIRRPALQLEDASPCGYDLTLLARNHKPKKEAASLG